MGRKEGRWRQRCRDTELGRSGSQEGPPHESPVARRWQTEDVASSGETEVTGTVQCVTGYEREASDARFYQPQHRTSHLVDIRVFLMNE